MLAGGVFRLVVAVHRDAQLDRVAALDPGEVVEPGVVAVQLVVGAISKDAGSTRNGHGRHHALRVGEGFGGVDVRAVGLGGEADGGGFDAALRKVEADLIQQGRPDGVDGVNHEAASGRIGVGDGAARNGVALKEPARLRGGNGIHFKTAPEVEGLAEAVIHAADFLAAVVQVALREEAGGGGGHRIGGGQRQLAEDVLDVSRRIRVDLAGGNLCHRHGTRRAGAVGQGETDRLDQRAGDHASGGQRGIEGGVGDDLALLFGEEEERLILVLVEFAGNIHRAADSAAIIVPAQRGNLGRAVDHVHPVGVVGPVVGSQSVVSKELVEAAMELAAAAFGDHVDLPATRAAAVGGVEAALHLELIDGVHAGEGHQREVAAAIHVVGAVHGPVVGRSAVAVDRVGQGGGGAGRRGVADVEFIGGAGGHARHQADQLLVVAGGEGQFAHLDASDGRRTGARAEFHRDGGFLHGHAIGDGANLQRDVDLQVVGDVENDARAGFCFEAVGFHLDGIRANRDDGRGVVAFRVRDDVADHLVAVRVGNGDFRVRYGGAAGIHHFSSNAGRNVLTLQRRYRDPYRKQAQPFCGSHILPLVIERAIRYRKLTGE